MTDFQEVTTRWRSRWYKVFPLEDLSGDVRYLLSPSERGVLYDLRNLAGVSPKPGRVCTDVSQPVPYDRLARALNVPAALVKRTLEKSIEAGLCAQDEHGVYFPDWPRRQSEYDRQKPYRESKREPDDPDKYVKGRYGHMVKR